MAIITSIIGKLLIIVDTLLSNYATVQGVNNEFDYGNACYLTTYNFEMTNCGSALVGSLNLLILQGLAAVNALLGGVGATMAAPA